MVDNVNPTNQFHPYQPMDETPQRERSRTSGLGGILRKMGIDDSLIDTIGSSMRNTNLRGGLEKARGIARKNPGLVLGGLAALAIGAGLLRRRSNRG